MDELLGSGGTWVKNNANAVMLPLWYSLIYSEFIIQAAGKNKESLCFSSGDLAHCVIEGGLPPTNTEHTLRQYDGAKMKPTVNACCYYRSFCTISWKFGK